MRTWQYRDKPICNALSLILWVHDAMSLHPIVDDATFARHVVEETVYVSRNHDIQIHEQAIAADIDLIVHEEA